MVCRNSRLVFMLMVVSPLAASLLHVLELSSSAIFYRRTG
jgi:hypothetical protein